MQFFLKTTTIFLFVFTYCGVNHALAQQIDESFLPPSDYIAEGKGYELIKQDTTIYVRGSFSQVNHHPTKSLARLNSDGSLDTDFTFQDSLLRSTSNRILAIQDINFITPRNSLRNLPHDSLHPLLYRLRPTGEVDTTFQSPLTTSDIHQFMVLPNRKIIGIFGERLRPDFVFRYQTYCLLPDGELDENFETVSFTTTSNTLFFAYHPAGHILIGGSPIDFRGSLQSIIKLQLDGVVDTRFSISGLDHTETIGDLAIADDGTIGVLSYPEHEKIKLTIAESTGAFRKQHIVEYAAAYPIPLENIASIGSGYFAAFGRQLSLFNADSIQQPMNLQPNREIKDIIRTSDDALLITGEFDRLGTEFFFGLAKIHFDSDFSSDERFTTELQAKGEVNSCTEQDDGKVVIVGYFKKVNDFYCNNVVRLFSDGSLDTTFNPQLNNIPPDQLPLGNDGAVYNVTQLTDNKLLFISQSVSNREERYSPLIVTDNNGNERTALPYPIEQPRRNYKFAKNAAGQVYTLAHRLTADETAPHPSRTSDALSSYDQQGNLLWYKYFQHITVQEIPQYSGERFVYDIVTLPNNDLLVCNYGMIFENEPLRPIYRLTPTGTPAPNFVSDLSVYSGVFTAAPFSNGNLLVGLQEPTDMPHTHTYRIVELDQNGKLIDELPTLNSNLRPVNNPYVPRIYALSNEMVLYPEPDSLGTNLVFLNQNKEIVQRINSTAELQIGTFKTIVDQAHPERIYIIGNSKINGRPISPLRINMPPVGVENINNTLSLNVFPNPTSDVLQMDLTDFTYTVDLQIKIFNASGELVKRTTATTNSEANISIKNLSAGTYFLLVSGKEQQRSSKFVVLE